MSVIKITTQLYLTIYGALAYGREDWYSASGWVFTLGNDMTKIMRFQSALKVHAHRSRVDYRFAFRRLLDFFGEALRETALLLTAKSSSFAPALSCSRNQTGCAPLPAHEFPDLSRYLTATLRPFRGLCPSRLL